MRNPDMAERLAKLRAALVDGGLDGVVIPRFDAYQGEVVAPHDERLGFVTGFTGSAIAYVGTERAVIFVDGRYLRCRSAPKWQCRPSSCRISSMRR